MTRPDTALAYRAHPAITRDVMIAAYRDHQEKDRLLAGAYRHRGRKFRGCAVGCGIHTVNRLMKRQFEDDDHDALAGALGWPVEVCHLADAIFEGLAPADAHNWPVQLATAIPDGADLSGVWPEFAVWLLREECLPRITGDAEWAAKCRAVIERVARGVETEWRHDSAQAAADAVKAAKLAARVAAETAASAAVAAWGAASAADAAWSAASAVDAAWAVASAADAPRAPAWAVAEAARAAAWPAAWPAARLADDGAWAAAYQRMADRLIALCEAAPVEATDGR